MNPTSLADPSIEGAMATAEQDHPVLKNPDSELPATTLGTPA
jgi:hypothetical protein